MSNRLASILGHRASARALTEGEIEACKIAWWRAEGGVCVKLDEITDDWLKAALANYARKRFGSRVPK